jgi:hypothetical protein
MFVRQKTNKSGSISVRIIDKSNGYRAVKTIGTVRDPVEVCPASVGIGETRRLSYTYRRVPDGGFL